MGNKLRQLQLCELEILDEFARICEKHGLRYYLAGGTLLGAIRHQGFIPWDDDIDVTMPREDYDRFAEIATTKLGSQFFYQSPETDPHYFLTYAKLRKNGTEIYEERFKNSKFHKGVYIDIFPLDFCPNPGPLCHLLFNVLAVMNYRGQVDSGETCEPYRELSGKIGYAVLRMFSARRLVNIRKKLLRLSKWLSRRQYVACYSGAYGYKKEIFCWAWYQQYTSVAFENKAYRISEMSDLLLSQMFGIHYAVVPPVENRTSHILLEKSRF